jgi:hypothetical protein
MHSKVMDGTGNAPLDGPYNTKLTAPITVY